MTREEYELNPSAHCKRGWDLPQTKLPPLAIKAIRESADKREQMRKEITEKYSNEALAKAWNVHVRTIEKVISFRTGKHVL